MIPPIPKEFDSKSDEGLVFNALKKLPDEYYVFHSVAITTVEDNTLFEREIDFLVAHREKGLLFIEAKNGSGIYCENRTWKYESGRPMQHDGPYHQIATAKRAVRSKIKCHANPEIRALYDKCRFIHAVFFMKMTEEHFHKLERNGLPEEATYGITLLAEDLINPTKKIESIFDLEMPYEKNKGEHPVMSNTEFQLLLDSVLCPAFNLIPSPSAKTMVAHDQMKQLLYEQYRLLDFLEDQDCAVINGAAGTGKTMVAVEKARRHSINDEKVLFLCYNRLLCEYLNEEHKKNADKAYSAQFKNVDFMTISKLTQKITGNFKDYNGLVEWLIDCAGDAEKFGYKHVIIDEGQDFGLIDATLGTKESDASDNCSIIDTLQDVVLENGGTFYLFYDKYQMIQGGSSSEYHLPDCINNSDCRLTLKRNCRNTKEIARTSVTPLRDSRSKAIKPTTTCAWFETIKPTMHLVKDEMTALKVLNTILDEYKKQEIEDVVIITEGVENYSFVSEHLEAKRESDVFFYYKHDGKKYPVTTCIKFKGLEADAIIMIDLNKQSFAGKKGLEFYVGTSRAKLRLDLLCSIDEEDYYEVVHDLDPNAPKKKDIERMRTVLGNTFSADIKQYS